MNILRSGQTITIWDAKPTRKQEATPFKRKTPMAVAPVTFTHTKILLSSKHWFHGWSLLATFSLVWDKAHSTIFGFPKKDMMQSLVYIFWLMWLCFLYGASSLPPMHYLSSTDRASKVSTKRSRLLLQLLNNLVGSHWLFTTDASRALSAVSKHLLQSHLPYCSVEQNCDR